MSAAEAAVYQAEIDSDARRIIAGDLDVVPFLTAFDVDGAAGIVRELGGASDPEQGRAAQRIARRAVAALFGIAAEDLADEAAK